MSTHALHGSCASLGWIGSGSSDEMRAVALSLASLSRLSLSKVVQALSPPSATHPTTPCSPSLTRGLGGSGDAVLGGVLYYQGESDALVEPLPPHAMKRMH